MMNETVKLKEVHNGFSERDIHSKAILNRDKDSLLKYKIQRNKLNSMTSSAAEIESLKHDIHSLKSDLDEIKSLLQRITSGRQ